MLSLIWSILNMVLIAVAFITFYRNKNKECVSFSKKVGTMCYSCSDEIEDNDPMDTYKRIVDEFPATLNFHSTLLQHQYIADSIIEFSLNFNISILDEVDLERYQNILFQLNSYKKNILNMNILASRNIYVLKVNNIVVSTAKLFVEDKIYESVGHIEDVVTDTEYRGHGYGKKLIKYLLHISLHKYNCYKTVFNCSQNLDEFYEKCGMTKTGSSFSVYKT